MLNFLCFFVLFNAVKTDTKLTLHHMGKIFIIIPQQTLWWGILFSCPSVRMCVCPSVTLWFFFKYLENAEMDIHQFLQTH